ncbi:MAG: YggU family protein [Nitrospira sp.]|nr:YggU family protein [Nitrospira sp.]
MTHPIVQDTKGGAILTIQVQPKASRSECVGLHGDALKIRIAAPPVDGKANEAVLAFLAQRLAVPPSTLAIHSGAGGRRKRVLCQTLAAADVLARLGLTGEKGLVAS